MTESRFIVVCGATGRQGGATARHLLTRGWNVHALVRDPSRPAAQELQERGAVLIQGDLDDEDSVRRAVDGAYGLFSVQARQPPESVDVEVRQGTTVADLAKESGVAHLVYSSVDGAERNTGIYQFDSKAQIERHLDEIGLPATVLRPVSFMDNLFQYADAQGDRFLSFPTDPDRPMQMIASDDIGYFAAEAFEHPEDYMGEHCPIASEALTFPQMAAIYEHVMKRPTQFRPEPISGRMYEWLAYEGYQVDIAALRELHPALLTLDEFLRRRVPERRPRAPSS